MISAGKRFEQCFSLSVPSHCFLYRLKDTAQSYTDNPNTKYTWNNPCDFFLFDTEKKKLYCVELKSTKNKYITFENIESSNSNKKMIHKHQILGLSKYNDYESVVGCFLFNFRDEENNTERTYFQDIDSFINMCNSIKKTSFNEIDLLLNNAIKIDGEKKRVNYKWNIGKLLSDIG